MTKLSILKGKGTTGTYGNTPGHILRHLDHYEIAEDLQSQLDALSNDHSDLDNLNWSVAAHIMDTALNMGTNLINNLLDPIADQDAATKKYVDDRFLLEVALFAAYDAGGLIELSTLWTDITWDTEILKDAIFTHSADSAETTIGETDVYEIVVELGIDMDDNTVVEARLVIDDGGGYDAISGTLSYCGERV